MRFLILNQFYPPDAAPTGCYLHELARELVRRGHSVKAICSRRAYDGKGSFQPRENLDGIDVVRVAATGFGRRGFLGKICDYISFYVSAFAALMLDRTRPDMILSLTTPPYLGLLGKLAAKRHRCGHAHWIMDLYPEVMFAHGMTGPMGAASWLLRGLTRFELRGAKAVLALGPNMAKKVSVYAPNGDSLSPVSWVPLWSSPELAAWPEGQPNRLRAERGWGQDVVFMYSGNMGLGHRFHEFLLAARRLGASGPRWVFAGGGKRRAEIETFAREHPELRIEFLGYVPQDRLREHLCAADVHLASLEPEWQGLMVPSKLQASFAVGRPVLYVGGRDCETAAWIEQSGGGWVVDKGDVDGMLRMIACALDAHQRRKCAEAALKFAAAQFRMDVNCSRIAERLESFAA